MTTERMRTAFVPRLLWVVAFVFPLMLYGGYLLFILGNTRAAVDYETFMSIGSRFRLGEPVWGENSFYPLPMVQVFAFFDALPRTLSVLIWHVVPVVIALVIARGRPWVLFFAPLFAHFLGGQTAVFGLLGMAIYRRSMQSASAGFGLALLLLKPQLGIFPLLWAGWQWLGLMRTQRRIPAQALVFAFSALLIYLPGFFIIQDWLTQWLGHARPLALRGLSALLPRSLLMLFPGGGALFWGLLIAASLLLLIWLVRILRGRLTFDSWMLWSYLVNPLILDYDLIQMIPLLNQRSLYRTAVLASLPLWLVIFFAYDNDVAWFAATLIAPITLWRFITSNQASANA